MKALQNMSIGNMQYGASNNKKFSWVHTLGYCPHHSYYNEPIVETKNFVVLPSLGSIVPGWLLVVPKVEVARFSEHPHEASKELNALVHRLKKKTEAEFDCAYLFEHGGHVGSVLSCGVDQAHLHIVPLPFDLLEEATSDSQFEWIFRFGLQLPTPAVGRDEYLYVSNFEQSATAKCSSPISQWFRKLIAQKLNHRGEWNYRAHPFHDNIEITLKVAAEYGY